MLGGIVAIPSVTLRGITGCNVLNELVGSNILVREPGTLLPWSFKAVLLLVSDCAAVLTCPFSVPLRGRAGSDSPVVPVIKFVGGVVIFGSTLVT
jgi:hypothetical protein